jgi:hypothetical protein
MPSLSSLLALTAALSNIALTAPLQPRQLSNFYLVTTTQSTPTSNSSLLANVSATSLFDPYDQELYLLRLIAPGYNSLPTFTLTSNNDLQTLAEKPETAGLGEALYNSTGVISAGEVLGLEPTQEPSGNLGLLNGYLLSVDGSCEGWTVCPGELEESVIYWRGNATGCVKTYIQAVANAPY